LKTRFILTALILLASPSLFADTVILVALPSELDAVRKEVRVVGRPVQLAPLGTGLAGHKVSIGYHKGEKIWIAVTGAGNLNSAMITQALLTRYKVDRVISVGVAGNLNDDWKVGDVLVATDVINHQQGKETPAGFETKQQRLSAISHQLSADYLEKCGELRSNATEITTEILLSPRRDQNDRTGEARTNGTTETLRGVYTERSRSAQGDNDGDKLKAESQQPRASIRLGRLVSGDSFIASSAKRKWLRETFHADAVDMVSAGIARVCEANGVPYVILRALSDNADEFASEDFARFVNAYKDPPTAPIAVSLVDRLARTAGAGQR